MPKFFTLSINIILLGALLLPTQPVLAQKWLPVRGGILFGISGMALLQQQSDFLDFLVVHDNKKANQGRLAIIRVNGKNPPEYLPLNWPSNLNLPNDLEALTDIPGKNKSEFIALASAGKAYHLRWDAVNKNISIVREFNLPKIPLGSNFEAFSLQSINNQLVAIWGHRGGGKKPAKIYWGTLNLEKYQITPLGSANFTVPFPSGNVRHISDIKVDSAGIVYISAANDNGDDGPFQSAVYVAGYFISNGNQIVWQQNTQLFPIYRDNYHKIEGLELIPGAKGGLIVGTDDENMGASIYIVGN
ncbi:MAG TPA: hypothetical protein VK203_22360 [Nostocaceae cyanobacterium]|nr:hypothetical protein [Nostocaceae cyanobacterium]